MPFYAAPPPSRDAESRTRRFFSLGRLGARSNSIIIPPAVMPLRIRERANKCIIHPCGIMKARARERSHYHERMDGRSPCESLLIRSVCSFECRKRTRETLRFVFSSYVRTCGTYTSYGCPESFWTRFTPI